MPQILKWISLLKNWWGKSLTKPNPSKMSEILLQIRNGWPQTIFFLFSLDVKVLNRWPSIPRSQDSKSEFCQKKKGEIGNVWNWPAFFLGHFLNIASFHGKHKIKTLTKKVSKFFVKKTLIMICRRMSGGIEDLWQKKRNRHENTPGKMSSYMVILLTYFKLHDTKN